MLRQSLRGAGLAALLLLSSCASPESDRLLVLSNLPETAFVIERYNHQTGLAVEFQYVEDLTTRLTQEEIEADVVIGRWVNTPPVNRLMHDRTVYFEGDGIDAHLLSLSPQWIPLSFNLPVLVFLRDDPHLDGRIAESLQTLERWYETPDPPIHFAPTVNPDTTYAVHRSLGFRPAVNPETGAPLWDSQDLRTALSTVADWQDSHNGGGAETAAYADRYLYEPPLRQLDKGRTSVVYLPSHELFDWQFFSRRDYEFRWLSGPTGTITAAENIVYGGIPQASKRQTAAGAFLTWLTEPGTQSDLAIAKNEARIEGLGVLDGFSTDPLVNRSLVADLYPEFAGRIPQPRALAFSGPLPRYWNEARRAVVAPYLQQTDQAGLLRDALDLWYRQRGD